MERVCEGCGAAPESGEEPYCEVCGRRLRDTSMDRVEVVVDEELAGVSDRGLRHRENQDRMGLWRGDGEALVVVCDGVSQSRRPEEAAQRVVATLLEGAVAGGEAVVLLREALALAVQRLQEDGACRGDCAATTVVAALVRGTELTVLWAGDSRAYWWADGGELQQLTADHTTEEQDGEVSHVLTRWVAADAGTYAEPEVRVVELEAPGVLLLCSDGLWNYAPDPVAMKELLGAALAEGGSAIGAAQALVQAALARGGDDHVSAVVLRVPFSAAE